MYKRIFFLKMLTFVELCDVMNHLSPGVPHTLELTDNRTDIIGPHYTWHLHESQGFVYILYYRAGQSVVVFSTSNNVFPVHMKKLGFFFAICK